MSDPGWEERVELIRAYAKSANHRIEVEASQTCGCFCCLKLFEPVAIEAWIDEKRGGQTAICPHCGIDAVIGSGSDLDITPQLLRSLKSEHFDRK